MNEDNELDLEKLTISEESDIDSLAELDLSNISLDSLTPEVIEPESEPLVSNDIIENNTNLTLGLTKEQIDEFYEYLAGKRTRPVFAEKFFADGESRIRESNELAALMGLSFVPKLLAVQESLINNLTSEDTLKYLSTDEKIHYLQTFAAMSTKFNDIAMKYSEAQKDFTGLPSIYRQLLDQLLIVSEDKLPRLKVIPKLVDLPGDIWNRIVEIANIKLD